MSGISDRETRDFVMGLLAPTKTRHNDLHEKENLDFLQDAVISTMALMTVARNHETGDHIVRTQFYVQELAQALAGNPRYAATLTPEAIEICSRAAALHDVGKIGVADSILLKPGRLTAQEFEEMKRHTVCGKELITAAKN